MSLTPEVVRWYAKANAVWQAWVRATGAPPPQPTVSFQYAIAQAQFETRCSDSWPGSFNWGACDLRKPTQTESDAIAAGTLKTGYWLASDGSFSEARPPHVAGILQRDSNPGPTGPVWFYVW